MTGGDRFDLFDWSARWGGAYRRPAIVACPCGRRRLVAREGESLRCDARCAGDVAPMPPTAPPTFQPLDAAIN